MRDAYESILFADELTPEQREALRDVLSSDPTLRRLLVHWNAVRQALRGRLERALPDRRLLILHALDESEYGDVLDEAERAAVREARPALEEMLEEHPALVHVFDDVRDAAEDFEEVWAAHFEASRRRSLSPASDRAPVTSRGRRRGSLRWIWRAAAAVAVAAFVGIVAFLAIRNGEQVTVTVAEGELRTVELADGSSVRLLGGSSLTYADPEEAAPFSRRVVLQGRAFFEVAPGEQGFTVETATALTTVLGTSFGVEADERATEVVLAAGKVALASKEARDRMVVLEPGQASRVVEGRRPSPPEAVDLTQALEWTRLFLFRSTHVEDIAARLGRHYEVAIAVAPSLRGEAVTGTFEWEQPVDEILEALAATLDATVHETAEGTYHLVPRSE